MTATEQITLHRVHRSGGPRQARGDCRCGWSVTGPAAAVERRSLEHEQGRR